MWARPAAELETGAREPERLGRSLREAFELTLELRATQKLRRDVGDKRCLALALLGLGCACPCPRRERADDDRSDDEDAEREPVVRIRAA